MSLFFKACKAFTEDEDYYLSDFIEDIYCLDPNAEDHAQLTALLTAIEILKTVEDDSVICRLTSLIVLVEETADDNPLAWDRRRRLQDMVETLGGFE